MEIDFTPFFKQYEELVASADAVFERVQKEFPECVKCKVECSDCCHALFDLSLIEALYINTQFNRLFKDEERERMIVKANRADRAVYKLKKKAYKDLKAGKNEDEIMQAMSKERIRCPLLNDSNICDMYEYRPITCRLYGIPTDIGGVAHTCGKSGFVGGKKYPTVSLDKIHNRLYEISSELVKTIRSRHLQMADMFVPLSMALLTDYDEEYLGIKSRKESSEADKDEA
jgi:Fe-S-cluster containining protein